MSVFEAELVTAIIFPASCATIISQLQLHCKTGPLQDLAAGGGRPYSGHGGVHVRGKTQRVEWQV